MELLNSLILAASVGLNPKPTPPKADSLLRVTPARVLNRISPWMYGSCIEDVNHEIYGGLYAQRIFGESFEEPPNASPLAGWTAFGGSWRVERGALAVGADAGAKLVRNRSNVADFSVSCDLRFADANAEAAGLILRVSHPRVGPDNWNGYEVSLNLRHQTLLLGRHRNDWEPLRSVPVSIEPGRWRHLRADLAGRTLRVFLDNAPSPLIEYTDGAGTLSTGRAGLRTWNSNVAFRNFTISSRDGVVQDSLDKALPPDQRAAVSGMWDAVVTGSARASYAWDARDPFNSARSQRITDLGGTGIAGIANRGLNRWGISVRRGRTMAGRLYLRGSNASTPVTVALQSADGRRTYAKTRLRPAGRAWSRRDFTLKPDATDPDARFAVWIERPGTVWVDQAYLSDTGRALFRGLPFRADIAEKLVSEGLTFLRYGGTMVNAPEYRWKKMIGDRDRRPQYRGHWYPYSTNGFGIEEFLQFCEAARFEPVFALNINETPQDAADLVEYLNGPVSSPWGAKRAANGHPKPYRVRYIEIGNEEALSGDPADYRRYLERFQALYAAMRPRDPSVRYVIAAWWNPNQPYCKRIAQALNGKAALWDVHVGGDGLRDADETDRTLAEMQRLFAKWIPGSSMRAAIFEENGGRHNLQRALGHARILNVTQRRGDFVRMDCPANCLQPFERNDNGWDQGQVFFLPDRVWGMPPYYAQRMAASNHLPLRTACSVESPNDDLDVTATRSEDGSTAVLMAVNSGDRAHRASLQWEGWTPAPKSGIVWTLTGELSAVNSPDAPERIRPVRTRFDAPGSRFDYVFPPHSYTILRLKRR
jgi:alpha-L-arabinofuranosidase